MQNGPPKTETYQPKKINILRDTKQGVHPVHRYVQWEGRSLLFGDWVQFLPFLAPIKADVAPFWVTADLHQQGGDCQIFTR